MKIAVHGLGRMGMQIARKLAEAGHQVIAVNRSPEPVDEAVAYGCLRGGDPAEVAASFGNDTAAVWVMLPAEVVNKAVQVWADVLPTGSIIINGANFNYKQTKQLSDQVKQKGQKLVDVGVSGGIFGYSKGFPMMIGGDDETAVRSLTPVFDDLAKPSGKWEYFGQSGSGHYVKMVHNAIEYGMMQSLAEGYRLLKESPLGELDLAAAGELWQHGSIVESWLNQLSFEVLSENPELNGINGVVDETGETRWALEVADELGISLPAIKAAFDVRLASKNGEVNFATKLLAAQRNKFGGHDLNVEAGS